MPSYIDDAGIHTTGVIHEQELLDIVNFYNQYFLVIFTLPGKVDITTEHWNNLKSAVITGAESAFDLGTLPSFEPGTIWTSTWPVPKVIFNSITVSYSNQGTTNVIVPKGCTCIYVNWLVGGGGGGGSGTETQNGGGGGGGGSGGWSQKLKYPVNAGDSLAIQVGWAGGWGGAGGSSSISQNGTVLASVAGGNGGGNAWAWGTGAGGNGGAPNGVAGGHGTGGGYDEAWGGGGTGGAGPFGGAGAGYWGNHYGDDASGYGSGGGGGGCADRQAPWNWHGGSGKQGYIEIQYLNAIDAGKV